MAEASIAPIASSQHLSEKIIAPFLRDSVEIAISSTRNVNVFPDKVLEKTDRR